MKVGDNLIDISIWLIFSILKHEQFYSYTFQLFYLTW